MSRVSRVSRVSRAKVQRVVLAELSPKALKQIADALAPKSFLVSAKNFDAIAGHAGRFTKVSAAGKLLPKSAADWEGVYELATGLVWARHLVPGEFSWSDAMKAASKVTLCGAPARAPTVKERFNLSDLSRVSPALDTTYFDPAEKSGWEWTSTPDAEAPSGSAWFVSLGCGGSYRGVQSFRTLVRAVRAGQFSDIGS